MNHAHGHGGRVHALAQRLGLDPAEILDFSSSINPLGPPPAALEKLRQRLDFTLRAYPPPRSGDLTRGLGTKLGISPNNVLIGNGATELIHLLPRLKTQGRALIVEPAFSEYRAGLEASGWEVEDHLWPPGGAPDNPGVEPESLAKRLEGGYDLVFLGRPANPGGGLADKELVLALAQAQAGQGLMVVDEAFIDFCPRESLIHDLEAHPTLVIIGSLTKFYAIPGLRLGYLAGPAEVVARLRELQPPWSVNGLAQEVGLACLDQEEYGRETRTLIQEQREGLSRELADMGLRIFPSAANYLLFRLVPEHPPAEVVVEELAAKAVLVRDCSNYRGLQEGYIRVAVRSKKENRILIDGLKEVLGR